MVSFHQPYYFIMLKLVCYFPAERPLIFSIEVEEDDCEWVLDMMSAIVMELHLHE